MDETSESVVEAMEAMVTAVDMLECLAPGKAESDRLAALRFFSKSLATSPMVGPLLRGEFRRDQHLLPLYWPGRLPALVPRLTDCLLAHNSKDIQSKAMVSIKHLLRERGLLHHIVFESNVPEQLITLAKSISNAEIRDEAVDVLRKMASNCLYHRYDNWTDRLLSLGCMPLITDIICKYAVIQKPTEADIASLNTATKALVYIWFRMYKAEGLAHIEQVLPALIGLIQEPGNRQKAQINALICLENLTNTDETTTLLFESGAVQVLMETLRAGKETKDVMEQAMHVFIRILFKDDPELNQMLLDAGVLAALHQVLKGPNDFKDKDFMLQLEQQTWPFLSPEPNCLHMEALKLFCKFSEGLEEYREAILNQEGLVDVVLELVQGVDINQVTRSMHIEASFLLRTMLVLGSPSLVRRLVSQELLLRVLAHHLTTSDGYYYYLIQLTLEAVQSVLGKAGPEEGLWLRRRLIDEAGITDALRRISVAETWVEMGVLNDTLAKSILDTYLNHPLPPRPISKLPSIIYTKNAP